jgi:N-acetylglucosamine-6-phosphate deacetylase
MKPQTLQGGVLTADGFVEGALHFEGSRITVIEGRAVSEPQARSCPSLILPGFIDLHVHGGGGADTMEAAEAVATLARCHARHGTTALLATTMTAPLAEIEAALQALAPYCRQRPSLGANVLGVHLEGPYLNAQRLGAQPDFARPATLDEILSLHRIAPIRVVTLAPEQDQNLALIPSLVAHGIRVQVGHSNASYEQAVQALEAGAAGFTHLFNAMGPFHHRAPGAAGAALAHAQHAEVIPDLLHVHRGALHAALRAIPGLFAVTDATAAAGMPDGTYRLGRQTVMSCMGGVRLADGTLAGSTLTMDRALRNLVEIGLTVQEASARVSRYPAQYLGLQDRGRLAVGACADVVVLDAQSLQVRGVWAEGQALEPAGGA